MSLHNFTFKFKKHIGYTVGFLLSISGLLLLMSGNHMDWHSPGHINTGHENLKCEDCHRQAPGDVRQQVQATIKFKLGARNTDAYFKFNPVSNKQCIDCHEKSNDRHPTQRFNEPRFSEVRNKIHPEECSSCHAEHNGKRVTQQNTGFCQGCHEEFTIKKDPISVPHKTLVNEKRWDTCLGCHDYHGNHKMNIETDVSKAISVQKINHYFEGGQSPYSGQIINKAKEIINGK